MSLAGGLVFECDVDGTRRRDLNRDRIVRFLRKAPETRLSRSGPGTAIICRVNEWPVSAAEQSPVNVRNVGDCGPNVLTHANDSFSLKLTFTEPPRNGVCWVGSRRLLNPVSMAALPRFRKIPAVQQTTHLRPLTVIENRLLGLRYRRRRRHLSWPIA